MSHQPRWMHFLQPYLMMIAQGPRHCSRQIPVLPPASSVRLGSTNQKSFTGFTSEIQRCIWLLPGTAWNLFKYCWLLEPTQTRHRTIGKAARYTTQQMATSSVPIGIQNCKWRRSNACSMPEPTSMPRTRMAPRRCIAPSGHDVLPRRNVCSKEAVMRS